MIFLRTAFLTSNDLSSLLFSSKKLTERVVIVKLS